MPDPSISPAQESTIGALGAIALEELTDGSVSAVDQALQLWVVKGDGEREKVGEDPPSFALPDDFDTFSASEDLVDVIKELRRPYTPAAVKWKVQAAMPRANPKRALVVPYIDARLVGDRLNKVVATGWEEDFEPVDWGGGRGAMLCRLTVCGVTRRDVGLGEYDAKGLVSDAFKRAAVKFGVGVFLYAMPKITLQLDSGHVRLYEKTFWSRKNNKEEKSKTLVLTDAGEAWLPLLYTRWLYEAGAAAFGAPLDHGDTAGSVGDVEEGVADADALADDGKTVDAPPSDEREGVDAMAAAVAKGGKK